MTLSPSRPGATPATRPAVGSPHLDVQGLTVRFPILGGILRRTVGYVSAVEDVSFAMMGLNVLGLAVLPATKRPP